MAKFTKDEKVFYIANKLVKELDYICIRDTFYHYSNGLWEKVHPQFMAAWISQKYMQQQDFGTISISQTKEIIAQIKSITITHYQDDIHKAFSVKTSNEAYLKDYILELDTLNRREYTREDFVFHKLLFNYKSENFECPIFKNFMLSIFGFSLIDQNLERLTEFKSTMNFIQNWMGYTLVHGNPYHVALIMVGAGRNGKGTLIKVWKSLLGEENVSYIDLSGINDGQQICLTKNKLVNFSNDLKDGQQLDTGVIKSAISGEEVTGKEVYKAPESFNFSAKLVIATNELPYAKNTSVALSERIHILPFNQTFIKDNQDIELSDKLAKEIEDIFSWAVKGLINLRKQGKFIIPETVKNAVSEFIEEQDPIKLWIKEDNVEVEGARSVKKQAYKSYQNHCKESGKKPLGKVNFYKKMQQMGFSTIRQEGYDYFENIKMPYDLFN
jgi:P4 family phage/plasmid primase-like protien